MRCQFVASDQRALFVYTSLRKQAYLNMLKILPPKIENFQIKIIFFIFLLKNIDCGYSYPQSMFLSSNKKNNAYLCKPQLYYIKVGVKGGSALYRHVFVMYYNRFIETEDSILEKRTEWIKRRTITP